MFTFIMQAVISYKVVTGDNGNMTEDCNMVTFHNYNILNKKN